MFLKIDFPLAELLILSERGDAEQYTSIVQLRSLYSSKKFVQSRNNHLTDFLPMTVTNLRDLDKMVYNLLFYFIFIK